MNLKEVEATQDEEDSFRTVTANILKEARENFASMKQEQGAIQRNSQRIAKATIMS